jgi:hypothetical protein
MQWLPRFVLQWLPVSTAAHAAQPYREDALLRRQPPVLVASRSAADGRGTVATRCRESRSLATWFDRGSLALSIKPAAL